MSTLSVRCLYSVPQHILIIPFSGLGSRSKFDVLVEKKERLLRKSVISYIGAASEFTGMSAFLFPLRRWF